MWADNVFKISDTCRRNFPRLSCFMQCTLIETGLTLSHSSTTNGWQYFEFPAIFLLYNLFYYCFHELIPIFTNTANCWPTSSMIFLFQFKKKERNIPDKTFTLDDSSVRSGMVIVCTRLPLTIRRISIVSAVNAITYGKAHTVRNGKRTDCIFMDRLGELYCYIVCAK